MKAGGIIYMGSWLWWIKILVIGLLSVFFLIFGIEVLVGSYGLKHPQIFIMYFFSGSFIILISIIGILYPVFQLYAFFKPQDTAQEND
jgi:hypothetical protein